MTDKSSHDNPHDEVEDRFSKLEEQVTNIFHSMALLITDLANKFVPSREVGGSNLEVGLDKKLGDNEDLEKEPQK
jgi:hypothetical protein